MKPYGPDRPGFEAKFVFPSSTDKKKAFFLHFHRTKTQRKFWYKVDRCLARYSPRAEGNNAIPSHTLRYDTIIMIALSQVQLRPKRCVI